MLIRHISVYLFTATIILYWQNIENQYVGQNLLRDLSLLTFDFYSHFPLTNGRGYLLSILGQMLPIGAPPLKELKSCKMLCHSPLPFVRFPIQWRFYARSIRWLPIIKRQYTYSRLIASFVLTQQFQLLLQLVTINVSQASFTPRYSKT